MQNYAFTIVACQKRDFSQDIWLLEQEDPSLIFNRTSMTSIKIQNWFIESVIDTNLQFLSSQWKFFPNIKI